MMNGIQSPQIDALFDAILMLQSRAECYRFFEDVCTVKEILDISQRLDVARALARGQNYNEVSKTTGASSATISRVNKCLQYGAGGYREVIRRLDQTKPEEEA